MKQKLYVAQSEPARYAGTASLKERGKMRKNCPMRNQENRYCVSLDGFCTTDKEEVDKAMQSAYDMGVLACIRAGYEIQKYPNELKVPNNLKE